MPSFGPFISGLRFVLIVSTVLILAPTAVSQENQQEARVFGGDYSSLEPVQRALINDWYARYNEMMNRNVDPEETYNALPQSTKTTFEAVTHALSETHLTDESGQSLGRPIDLIDKIESIAGKVKGARGDKQFRIYVQLKPDAIEALKRSQEFERGPDNAVFHKGYPVNYRAKGLPSIQFSIALDEKRADIDVDYRSSKFPQALFNGHLTASNSDIRAGNNHGRHVNRWEGLLNWWQGWFGLPLTPGSYDDVVGEGEIPLFPRKGKGNIDEAVFDFLESWLVEQKPNLSMAYMSERALECMAFATEEEARNVDQGMAPYYMLREMEAANDLIGRKDNLEGVTVGVRVHNVPGLVRVRQPRHAQAAIYGMAPELAAAWECANRNVVGEYQRPKRVTEEYGEFFGSVFHIDAPDRQGATIALLWARENDYWKIVSYETEPVTETDAVIPDHRPTEEASAAEVKRVEGDPELIRANREFFESWFIKKDYEATMAAFAPRAYMCTNLFLPPGKRRLNPLNRRPTPFARTSRRSGKRWATSRRSRASWYDRRLPNPSWFRW